jgi:hypothetical protein
VRTEPGDGPVVETHRQGDREQLTGAAKVLCNGATEFGILHDGRVDLVLARHRDHPVPQVGRLKALPHDIEKKELLPRRAPHALR